MKRIVVTGGAGQIAYSLLFRLANGELFREELELVLVDLPDARQMMEGVAMELEDCAFPFLKKVVVTSEAKEAFYKADVAFLVGAKPRGLGMERKDLLYENAKIFVEMGRALNEAATDKIRVLVVGNPCNTNCLIALHHAPKIPKKNFQALMRLDHNRALGILAKKAEVSSQEVKKMVVWGNHSTTQVPDFTHVEIAGKKVEERIDLTWLREEFVTTVQKRGAQVIQARGKSSSASAAQASLDAMRSIFTPTTVGDFFSTALYSDENPYGIEKGIVFGFPCTSKGDGDAHIVEGLTLDHFFKEEMAITQKELLEERESVKEMLQ